MAVMNASQLATARREFVDDLNIPVILGGETYYENGVPCVRGGALSEMDTALLDKRVGVTDNDIERTEVTEYWMGDKLVHRSVNMHLKTGIFAEGITASF